MSPRFFTNHGDQTLLRKFRGIFENNSDIEWFDALVGYLRASGYFAIRPHLDKVPRIRILVGINVDAIMADYHRRGLLFLADPTKAMEEFKNELRSDIQSAAYKQEIEAGILQFIEDVISKKIELRAHPTKRLHAKLYIFRPKGFNEHKPGAVITGSSNLTGAGLGKDEDSRNYEFNVLLHDYADVRFAADEFERLWLESVEILPKFLQEVRDSTYLAASVSPYELYFKLLLEYFGASIEYDPNAITDMPDGFKRLTYQVDAVTSGFRLLEKHGGFFLADVVGLGKTIIATLIAKKFFFHNGFPEHRSHTLIVLPPAVEDSWRDTIESFRLDNCDIITNGSLHKVRKPERYDLIIVDEAHKFRNDTADAFDDLQRICKSPTQHRLSDGTRAAKKVILVSATPLNNRPDDIRNLISLFQDLKDSTLSIGNLQHFFAQREKDYRLRLDIYNALIDLARLEFTRARMDAAGLGMALDDEATQRVAELDKGLTEINFIAAQLRDARRMRAQEQEDALERIRARFDDPAKPTFIWQLDFAEVFHRAERNESGSLLPAESASDSSMAGARNGFDLVIGNPPYIRLQTLKQAAPHLVDYYKRRFRAASRGNYDLYVVFVERSLELLHERGQLAFILPHKFFNAQYGEPLRKLLADGKHLRHVVHFGDQQIFPGATNYVCLLFLARTGVPKCRFVRADNLKHWLATFEGIGADFPAKQIGAAEWNFVVGKGAGLFEKLQRMPMKLCDATDIFVGLQTSADDVFIMNFVSETARTITLESKILERPWTFEKELLHPVVSGTDVSPFAPLPSRQFILFPYRVENEQAELIPLKEMADSWPRTAEYLKENKGRLEGREGNKLQGTAKWHGYIYLKNMARQSSPKLCVPRLVEYLHAAPDFEGSHFLDNVDVGGVTFKESTASHSLAYLLALLNSRLLRWFFPQVAAPFRGGFRSANKQFLSLMPFRPINFADAAEQAEHGAVVGLVERVLAAKRANPAANTQTWEQEINEHVYRLYALTPEEIKLVEER